MAYKLIESAQVRSSKANAPQLVAPVRAAGALFHKGMLLEPRDITPASSTARPTPLERGSPQT